MKNSFSSLTLGIGISLCLMFSAGCTSSAPSRYYVLNSLAPESKTPAEGPCIAIGIGPVKLPEYVNRPQIVTRSTPNELLLSHLDLWAEPLADALPRVLAENLSRLLCIKEIAFFPWKPSRMPDYRVELEVLNMDGMLGRNVSLEAWWRILRGAEKKALVIRRSSYTDTPAGEDYDALVRGMSRLLAAFSRDIADALRELNASTPSGKRIEGQGHF